MSQLTRLNQAFLQRMQLSDRHEEEIPNNSHDLLAELEAQLVTLTEAFANGDRGLISRMTAEIAVQAMFIENLFGYGDEYVIREDIIVGEKGEKTREYWYTCVACESRVCVHEEDSNDGMELADAYVEHTLDWYFTGDGPLCNICL